MRIDYFFKFQVMETEIPSLQKHLSKFTFYLDNFLKHSDYTLTINGINYTIEMVYVELEQTEQRLQYLLGDDYQKHDYFLESVKINYANYKRVKRLKDKVANIITSPSLFLTLTFSDKYIKRKKETLKKYAQRFLKELNCPYIANIDYGKQNGRLHFHALVQKDYIDNSNNKLWKYGDLDIKHVFNDNSTAIAKYISKLTNHAIKETTHGCRIMYSR